MHNYLIIAHDGLQRNQKNDLVGCECTQIAKRTSHYNFIRDALMNRSGCFSVTY